MRTINADTIVKMEPFFCDGCHDADVATTPHLITFRWGTSIIQFYCRQCSVAAYEVADSRTFVLKLEEIR